MYKVKNTLPTIHLYLLFIFFGAFLFAGNVSATAITNIAIDPTLDISYFDSYTLSASISAEPASASITLNGMNKAGGSDWIYYADGTIQSSPLTYSMSNLYGTTWAKTSIRPDNIYPTILFTPASLTWSTTPLDTIIRRNNYQILHFTNPFVMTDDMNFWIEINATPASTVNSTDLLVYLVKKGKKTYLFLIPTGGRVRM